MRSTLSELVARRRVLLERCARVDRRASELREKREPLDLATRAGFEAHAELRLVEHEIFKLRERK
jgi:hypothetical protein